MPKREEEAREREKRERERRERRERNSGGGDNGDREFEHDEGNAAHIEIEERRFRGGLPPTPELYARAREQWNHLPGSVARSAGNPLTGKLPVDPEDKPAGEAGEDKKEGSP